MREINFSSRGGQIFGLYWSSHVQWQAGYGKTESCADGTIDYQIMDEEFWWSILHNLHFKICSVVIDWMRWAWGASRHTTWIFHYVLKLLLIVKYYLIDSINGKEHSLQHWDSIPLLKVAMFNSSKNSFRGFTLHLKMHGLLNQHSTRSEFAQP